MPRIEKLIKFNSDIPQYLGYLLLVTAGISSTNYFQKYVDLRGQEGGGASY